MFQSNIDTSGVKNESSMLGLYNIKNLIGPRYVYGFGDQGQMDRETADHMWQFLKNAIHQIQSQRHSELNFEELYRYGYYLVLHKYGGMVYSELKDVIKQHITHKVRSKVLTNLNNNFLHVITRSWDNHQLSMYMIRDIFMYMDRVYVKHYRVDDIYTLGMNLFTDHVVYYDRIQSFLQRTLLELVLKERRGEAIDRPVFRTTAQMLMALGNNTPKVYQENFEQPFLEESAQFFRNESQRLMEEGNAPLYLRTAEQRISQEIERSESCFEKITKPQIIKVVEDELIGSHLKRIVEMHNSGVVYMIKNALTDDLRVMYQLLSRVPDGLKTMFESISSYLREQGRALVVNDESSAITYIQNLLDLKDNVDNFLINSFEEDKLCKQMIACDFEYILNLNYKSPEYLSLFIDDRLKRAVRGMNDEERSLLLDKTMIMFRLLQDKDLFEQYYKQHLAKRLLLSCKAVNEDNEMGVIKKLRAECGLQYTRKMEGMFRDIWTSSDVTDEFRNHVTDAWDPSRGVELSVRVLTAVYWPPNGIPSQCVLPSRPLTAFETFREFYLSKHCGRQLTLLPHLGSAVLEYSFLDPLNGSLKSYTLTVSTYLMCILMMFNTKCRWTFQELQNATAIPPKDLIRSLQSLSSGKSCQNILTRHSDSDKIQTSDVFCINIAFSSKSSKLKILPFQIKYEVGAERQEAINKVNEDRKHEVEAAIIRIMKAHKSMKHETLTNEVTKLLSARFIPTKEIMKTRIEVLIEREFLVRNANDRKTYEYVA